MFGDQSLIFDPRYWCMRLVIDEEDDFLTRVGMINRESELFKLKKSLSLPIKIIKSYS